MITWLRRLFCQHRSQNVEFNVCGVDIGADLRPARAWAMSRTCMKCGGTVDRKVVTLPGDRDRYPECYAADGWPIDPSTGRRLDIEEAVA